MGREEQVLPADNVRIENREGVVVIFLNNPPTAALSANLRSAFAEKLDEAENDAKVKGIVITGSDHGFATGAGVQEDPAIGTPDLDELCDQIEALNKPVCAAINGVALGGGLELALAAHLRLAVPDARLGAPEITLGLVPNAGGTQRLPKVVGGVAALKMLLSGRAVSGTTAHQLGLVDGLDGDDLVGAAVARVTELAESGGELRRSSLRRERLGEGAAFLEAVSAHRKIAENSALDAPLRLIECIEAALLLPYDVGRGLESAAYDDLVLSEHSKSLRHIFSAERRLQAASRWEGKVMSRPMSTVAVVGARDICAEIIVLCLDAGFSVIVAEESDEALEDGVARIIEHFDARIIAKQLTEESAEQILDRMQAVSGYGTVSDADIIIDPSPNLTKARVNALDSVMKAGAVLAIGAENVRVSTVATSTKRSADIVGLRFYPGVRKNRLVEITAGANAGPKAVATARAFARKLDRLILDTSKTSESVGAQLFEALHAAADLCLEDGARFGQIDIALRDWGLPYGSFGYRDLIGINRVTGPRTQKGVRGGGIDHALLSAKRFGISTNRGYYIYPGGGKPAVEDTEVLRLIDADRTAKGIRPRTLSDGEVRMRCVAAMAGAGAQMLTDECIKRPGDIDMAAIHGMGFARRTGGIMFAADQIGLQQIRHLLMEMSQVSERISPPVAMFQDLIQTGKGFSDLN